MRPDTLAPSITSLGVNPTTPTSSDSVIITATIQDTSDVASATLQYRVGTGSWTNVSMSSSGTTYTGVIPPHDADTTVTYRIVATDTIGNEAISIENSYTVASDEPTTTTTVPTEPTTTEPTSPPPTTGPPPPLPQETMTIMMMGMFAVALVALAALAGRRKRSY